MSMRYVGEKWFNTGISVRIFQLFTVFSLIWFPFFGYVKNVKGSEVPPTPPPSGQTVSVTASVPLSPEFAYSIRKNSSLALAKVAFAPGEAVQIHVRIAGGRDEPLRGHMIRLQAVNSREETLFTLHGETGSDGLVQFSFVVGADFLGSDTLRAFDVTYDAPIPLSGAFFSRVRAG